MKLPGPMPTTTASISLGWSPASRMSSSAAASTARASVIRSPSSSPSHRSAHDVREVAVSKAKIVLTVDADTAVRLVDVRESHGRAHRRKPGARVLRPLDERNRAIEVRLEVAPLLGAEPTDAVEIEMRDWNGGCGSFVAVRERCLAPDLAVRGWTGPAGARLEEPELHGLRLRGAGRGGDELDDRRGRRGGGAEEFRQSAEIGLEHLEHPRR